MHIYISSHRLKRSQHLCPRWVNAGNKNIQHPPSTKTSSMFGLQNSHIRKNLTQNGESQRYSWECRRRRILYHHSPPAWPQECRRRRKRRRRRRRRKEEQEESLTALTTCMADLPTPKYFCPYSKQPMSVFSDF